MPPANYVLLDPMDGLTIVNDTDVEIEDISSALAEQEPWLAEVANAMTRWTHSLHRNHRGSGGIIDRDKYVTPRSIYDQMRVAQEAAESDNVVAGVLESTEALAFSRMSINSFDKDEEDIWNQVLLDLDLDARFREMWAELFTVSQFYAATWWGRKDYNVRGRSKQGVKRKKSFKSLMVPVGVTILDPLKIVPVGNMMFNQEQLCYIANRDEGHMISTALDKNRSDDEIVNNLIVGPYNPPDEIERMRLAELGLAQSQLFLLNPNVVWRHTATRPQYKRFSEVRLKSVFELLDLKHQLREMDRAHLLGSTNFIVLIKKGDDKAPATGNELQNLQGGVRSLAKVPIIVSDHRLSIEIITPKTDKTLDETRHSLLDGKIATRLYQTFMTSTQLRGDDTLKLARVVARGLESRRYMLKKAFEKQVMMPTFDKNDSIIEEPKLVFHPHQIALDFDTDLANYLLDLRDRGDISRETILSQIDLDEDDEYIQRKLEKESGYDDVFQTQVPFTVAKPKMGPGDAASPSGSPANSPRTAGRNRGGNRNGGGRAPGTGQGQHSTEEVLDQVVDMFRHGEITRSQLLQVLGEEDY